MLYSMTREGRRHLWAGVILLSTLPACDGHVVASIQPAAVPTLVSSMKRNPKGWHDTMGSEGEPLVLKGPVREIEIRETTGKSALYDAPLQVTLSGTAGSKLEIHQSTGVERFNLPEIADVQVHYTSVPSKYLARSAIFLSLSLPLVICGGVWTNDLIASDMSFLGKGPAVVTAATVLAVGAALAVPGIIYLGLYTFDAGDPRKDAQSAQGSRRGFVGLSPRGIGGAF
jgi:hypothetical protein